MEAEEEAGAEGAEGTEGVAAAEMVGERQRRQQQQKEQQGAASASACASARVDGDGDGIGDHGGVDQYSGSGAVGNHHGAMGNQHGAMGKKHGAMGNHGGGGMDDYGGGGGMVDPLVRGDPERITREALSRGMAAASLRSGLRLGNRRPLREAG